MSAKDEREVEKESAGADVLPPISLHASSSLDKDLSTLSSDGQPEIQKTEPDPEQEPQPERPENQPLEGCVEEGEEEKNRRSRPDIKGTES